MTPDLLMNPISDAFDQLTDETSQKIVRIEFELWAGGKLVSGAVKVVQWVVRGT